MLKTKHMKKINILILSFFLITACGGFQEAGKVLRNEKVRTSDEFLVKKKNPLELPPNFEDVPLPNSKKKQQKSKPKIEEILNMPKVETSSKTPSSVEESILSNIRK